MYMHTTEHNVIYNTAQKSTDYLPINLKTISIVQMLPIGGRGWASRIYKTQRLAFGDVALAALVAFFGRPTGFFATSFT